jgi:hypothetical protein
VNIVLHCFNNFNIFVTLSGTRLRLPEDDADALKHAGVLTIYKILLIYIYIYCAFVGLDNKIQLLVMYIFTIAYMRFCINKTLV